MLELLSLTVFLPHQRWLVGGTVVLSHRLRILIFIEGISLISWCVSIVSE